MNLHAHNTHCIDLERKFVSFSIECTGILWYFLPNFNKSRNSDHNEKQIIIIKKNQTWPYGREYCCYSMRLLLVSLCVRTYRSDLHITENISISEFSRGSK